MAFTGEAGGRRGLLRALALSPLLWLFARSRAYATDYASAAAVFDAVEALVAEVEVRLRALAEAVPGAKAFVLSALADLERHRRERDRLRRRLRLAPAATIRPDVQDPTSLEALHTAQEALVHAYAEGLPALGDDIAVDVMARHLVDLSRQLAVIDLWIEAEANLG